MTEEGKKVVLLIFGNQQIGWRIGKLVILLVESCILLICLASLFYRVTLLPCRHYTVPVADNIAVGPCAELMHSCFVLTRLLTAWQ